MLIKNHPEIPCISKECTGHDLRPVSVNKWKISDDDLKKPGAPVKPAMLLPEQPKSFLKPKKFDFF